VPEPHSLLVHTDVFEPSSVRLALHEISAVWPASKLVQKAGLASETFFK
jgi:hypothetical protein